MYFLWLPDLFQWLHHHGSVVQPTHTDWFLHRVRQQEMVGLWQWICDICAAMDGRQLPSWASDIPYLRSHQKWSERNWEVSIETCLATCEERRCGFWRVVCNWSLVGDGDILDRQHATHVLQCLLWTGMSRYIFQEIQIIEKLLMISFINIKDINVTAVMHRKKVVTTLSTYQLRKVIWFGHNLFLKKADQLNSIT